MYLNANHFSSKTNTASVLIEAAHNFYNMVTPASVLTTIACDLGESPMWHSRRQSCFWVDIEGRKMFEYKWLEKKVQHWQMPERISMIAEGENNALILALQ